MSNPSEDALSVVVEREYPHSAQKLWRALSQSHLIEEWLMKNDFLAEVGHQFQLRGDWGGVLDGEVLALDPGRSLSYTWNYRNDDPAFDLRSVVTFTLTPTATGTLLRVEQVGFKPTQKKAHAGAKMGWKNFTEKLAGVLARTE